MLRTSRKQGATVASIDRALAMAGTHSSVDIAMGVAEGRFQRWGDGDSVIITELLRTPKRLTLHFFLAEGTLPELRAMVPAIVEWGRQQGCTHASLVGREGWRRVKWMADDGWRFKHVVMEKEL